MEQYLYIQNNEMFRDISSYYYDTFFHYLLINHEGVRLLMCQHLLKDVKITSTKVHQSEKYPFHDKKKKFVLDILAEDDNGNIYNIEMQSKGINKSDIIRFQCYGARLLSEKPKRGIVGYDELEDIHQLIINAGKPMSEMQYYEERFVMTGEKYKQKLPYAKLHTTYIQLAYLGEKIKEDKELDEFDQLMYLFANSKPYDIMRVGKLIKEVMIMYQRFLDSNEAIFAYNEEREKILLESYIHESWVEGAEDERRKNVCLLLKSKYHIDSVEWIDNCTAQQLSKIFDYIYSDISMKELKEKILHL